MNEGENKTPLALMEQVIMVFVFALASALCVQVFVYSRTVSISMENRDRGMVICQSIAETAKCCLGQLEEMNAILDGCESDNELFFFYDEKWNQVEEGNSKASYQAVFHVVEEDEFYQSGEVTVLKTKDGSEVFSLQTAWQKPSGQL